VNISGFIRNCVAATLMAASCAACGGGIYSSAPISGQVVDAQSKQPLEGVAVVAEWQIFGGGHGQQVGRVMLLESVTDAQGRYRFEAWGPRVVAPWHWLGRAMPYLHFYKRGYNFKSESNGDAYAPHYVPLPDPLISVWDGKVIELERFSGELSLRSDFVELMRAGHLYTAPDDDPCAWERIPRMTAELMKRDREYIAKNLSSGIPKRNFLHKRGRCTDPDILLGDILRE